MLANVVSSGNTFTVENLKTISGQRKTVSVGQPNWTSDDVLLFLNDSSGYVNPWSYSVSTSVRLHSGWSFRLVPSRSQLTFVDKRALPLLRCGSDEPYLTS